MRKLFIFLLATGLMTVAVQAQHYVVVDTRLVFEKMPEYAQVQKQVDAQAATWQKEIDAKQAVLDRAYDDYEAQESMMSDKIKQEKEDELFNMEKELMVLQKQRFGFEGDLYKKRMELMEPLQTRVAEAIKRMAAANGYDMVFDKSEGKSIIFADPKLDKSEELIKELRLK